MLIGNKRELHLVIVEPAYGRGGSALQAAAGRGRLRAMEMLLDLGADINAAPGEVGGLQAAAEGRYLDLVRRLLDFGADIDAASAWKEGYTALQAAAGAGHIDVVKLFAAWGRRQRKVEIL